VIDRSKTRDTPIGPMAVNVVALLGTRVAETILASGQTTTALKGRTYGSKRSDQTAAPTLVRRGSSTYGP